MTDSVQNEFMPSLDLRQNTLLLFISGENGGSLDPIKIMKGLFIFAQESPKSLISPSGKYNFSPYHYGPFSQELYNDLDLLASYGFFSKTIEPGKSWSYYSITKSGKQLLETSKEVVGDGAMNYLFKIRSFVTNLSFKGLLSSIYNHYPDYATNSVFRS